MEISNTLKILFDRRVLLSGFLLLFVVIVDHLILWRFFEELDIIEHFLFGFVISEVVSRALKLPFLNRLRARKMKNFDLCSRLIGFLIIGGLIWESMERFLFPLFGAPYNPFFRFPITLYNIDGTIDVVIGIFGCIISWYTKQS